MTPLNIAQAKNWEDGIFILKQHMSTTISEEASE